MKRCLWLAAMLVMAAAETDVTGRWTGTVEVPDPGGGGPVNAQVRAEFEQKSNVVSGSIGRLRNETPEPIRNGRLQGDRLLFEVTPAETNGSLHFELTVTRELLEGTMKGNIDSGPITGKVRLTRRP